MNVGNLVGGQIEITGIDRNRTDDIRNGMPRSYTTNIAVNIPEGYTVSDKSIESLGRNISNETGRLEITASCEGNTLRISFNKIYANGFEPLENWQKLLEIIDNASSWQSSSILLEKI